jgi:Bacterial Ig-like domain (group 2)/Abnormal spindle-like microcephaly-assoc'd, ASPM-SPD-2-Hydin
MSCPRQKPFPAFFLVLVLVLALSRVAFSQTSVTPSSLTFGSVVAGETTAAQGVSFENTQSVALTFSSIVISGGPAPSDYGVVSNCPISPNTLASGQSCTISVTFTPSALGALGSKLEITDNASNSPQSVSLTGTGTTPLTLSANNRQFATRMVGTTSGIQSVTLTNNLNSELSFSSIAASGDFAVASNNCGSGLAAAQQCTVGLDFTPTAAGLQQGSLTISYDGVGSPALVALSGTGTSPIPLTLSVKNRQFASRMVGTTSGIQSVTLTNNLGTELTFSSIATSAPFAIASNNCGSTLAAGQQCTVGLDFTPTSLGLQQGTLTISYNSASSPALVALSGTGNETQLASISVAPSNPSIASGGTQQFTAAGNLSTGSTVNLTPYVTWGSSAANVATVTTGGLATAVANGTSTISATLGTIAGSTTATVSAPAPVSVSITPASPSITAGGTEQFTATANYSNGTQQNLTASAIWSSSTPGVAIIASGGLATGVTTGNSSTTNITACVGSVCGSTSLTVGAATLSSISVTPANVTVSTGSSLQFAATGVYSDGSSQDLTLAVGWSSSGSAMSITSAGLATGVTAGRATITAALGSVVGSTGMTVTAASQISAASEWLEFLGDGSEGAYSCASGTCALNGEHWFSSFSVSAGATVAESKTNTPLVIRSTGACAVAGTVSNSPNSSGGGNTNGNGDFGGGGGGGGGGAATGGGGREGIGDAAIEIINGGSGGAAGGGSGANGNPPAVGQYRMLLSGGSFWPVGGATGGAGGSSGGSGGLGGGAVILVCNSVNFTGTVDVSGGSGGASPGSNSGAGGGGGAGYVIFSAVSYNVNSGTINAAGGTGGSCNSNSECGAGGNGGSSWNKVVTIP